MTNNSNIGQNQTTSIEPLLRQIANMLIVNGTLLENSGLWYGKMGVAIFFCHYAQCTENELYMDYAVEIINVIRAEIHQDSITDYDRGLAGIGAGVEYLSHTGFLTIDTDKVLRDIDKRIQKEIIYTPQENNSIANGLCGLGQYLLYRCKTFGTNEMSFLINQEFIMHIMDLLENGKNPMPSDFPNVLSFLYRLYPLDICKPKIERYTNRILADFSMDAISDEWLFAWVLALLRMGSIREQTIDIACKTVDRAIQALELMDVSSTIDIMDLSDRLLWLLQCKSLISDTGIGKDSIDRLDILVDRTFKQSDQTVQFEKGKLSLKGCAGIGLAMMTSIGKCDDVWLNLLG